MLLNIACGISIPRYVEVDWARSSLLIKAWEDKEESTGPMSRLVHGFQDRSKHLLERGVQRFNNSYFILPGQNQTRYLKCMQRHLRPDSHWPLRPPSVMECCTPEYTLYSGGWCGPIARAGPVALAHSQRFRRRGTRQASGDISESESEGEGCEEGGGRFDGHADPPNKVPISYLTYERRRSKRRPTQRVSGMINRPGSSLARWERKSENMNKYHTAPSDWRSFPSSLPSTNSRVSRPPGGLPRADFTVLRLPGTSSSQSKPQEMLKVHLTAPVRVCLARPRRHQSPAPPAFARRT